MPLGIVRLLDTNLAQLAATIISASSQDPGFLVTKLRDQSLGATYRSLLGWTVVAGFNDKIDFNRGGVKVATITPGNYPTATLYAAAVVAALTAADANTWTCTYSATTFKFTIGGAAAFTLLFSTGTNVATSAHLDLGYTSTDKGSATSQVAENVAYQSRHYLLFDLGSALAVTAGVLRNHNSGTGGTYTLYGKSSNNPWVTPGAGPTTLAGDADIRLAYFGSSSMRYWAIVINDVQNSLGYAEVGIAAPFTYRQPSFCISVNFDEQQDDRSALGFALSGASYQTRRQRQRGWSVEWAEMPLADQVILDAWGLASPRGSCFFFSFDAVDNPSNTVYCFRDSALSKRFVPAVYYTYQAHLTEAVP